MRLIVVGDIHSQKQKLWKIFQEAGLTDAQNRPSQLLMSAEVKLILLGDLVHAKSRAQYARLTELESFDEYNPRHIEKAEIYQERFLIELKRFYDAVPSGSMHILMGNHDYNVLHPEQGPLRTDDVAHLEWKDVSHRHFPQELEVWLHSWPHELVIEDIHLAHVGPLKQHNIYDSGFYLENRRRWIYEDKDFLTETPYRLGIYGHTPVRGGVNIASQGRALLLDTNGHEDEYCFLDVTILPERYRVRMRGLFFDELIQRK